MEAEYRINEVLRWKKKRYRRSTGAQTACPLQQDDPRRFEEKYKEQNPEKYADTIERSSKGQHSGRHAHLDLRERDPGFPGYQAGNTGAGRHFGYGGHTTEMLKKLEGQGHMYALDVDPIEIVKTKERLKERGFGEGDPYDKTDELCRYRQARPGGGAV